MKLGIASLYLLSTVIVCNCATAQISSDGTLSTDVTTNDAINFLIENGDRTGDNLFHSFSEFSIPNLGEAYFNNATDIVNIFIRVTVGNISEIQGLIRANGTANLFLINPAGIVFGENASLDIGGSFFATTAESVVFGDGIEFSATQPEEAPLLTVNITPGLQMGANPGSIQVQGINQNTGSDFTNLSSAGDGLGLQVQPGKTIGLLGGNILIEGKDLIASSGRIELGSVAPNSFVQMLASTEGWTLDYQGVKGFQDITLTQATLIDTSGNNGGNIQIQGRQIRVDDSTTVSGRTSGVGNGGTLLVRASELLEVIGGENATRFSVSLAPGSSGQGGDIVVETGELRLVDGGQLGAGTLGSGDTGNITVRADEVNIIGTASSGDFPSGLFVTVQAIGTGNGGDLIIETDSLQLTDGGILAAFTIGHGNAGNITIQANEIDISGSSVFNHTTIDAFSTTASAAGSININTDRLRVADGADITVSAPDLGNAGNININANEINLDTQGSINANEAFGNRGNINLTSDLLLLRNNSNITTNAGNQANGGNISIETVNLVALENSDITANAVQGQGGNILVTAQGLFLSPDSNITASSQFGVDGVVTINNPDTDNRVGLLELPKDTTDASQKIAEGCAWVRHNSFMVTGRGGTPENPTNNLGNDQMWSDIRDLSNNQSSVTSHQSLVSQSPLIEANGWIVNEQGNVELVAVLNPQDIQNHFLPAHCVGQ